MIWSEKTLVALPSCVNADFILIFHLFVIYLSFKYFNCVYISIGGRLRGENTPLYSKKSVNYDGLYYAQESPSWRTS